MLLPHSRWPKRPVPFGQASMQRISVYHSLARVICGQKTISPPPNPSLQGIENRMDHCPNNPKPQGSTLTPESNRCSVGPFGHLVTNAQISHCLEQHAKTADCSSSTCARFRRKPKIPNPKCKIPTGPDYLYVRGIIDPLPSASKRSMIAKDAHFSQPLEQHTYRLSVPLQPPASNARPPFPQLRNSGTLKHWNCLQLWNSETPELPPAKKALHLFRRLLQSLCLSMERHLVESRPRDVATNCKDRFLFVLVVAPLTGSHRKPVLNWNKAAAARKAAAVLYLRRGRGGKIRGLSCY